MGKKWVYINYEESNIMAKYPQKNSNMVFKFFLASICCFSLVCGFLPNAREIIRDEQLASSLSEQTKSLSLVSSPGQLHPFMSQIQRDEYKIPSEFHASSSEWKEGPSQIESLKKDSIELMKLIPDLQRTVERLGKIQAHYSKKFLQRAIDQFSESIKILEAANQKIYKLKQIKRAELGDVEMQKSHEELLADLLSQDSKGPAATAGSPQPLRYDRLAKTSANAIKNYGDGIVNDLKKVLAIRKSDKGDWELLDHEDFLIFQETTFKMIDFLIKYDFANSESVRKIFQEFDLVGNVVKYVGLAITRHVPSWWWLTSSFRSHTTEHWYWKYLHHSFEVLSEREERNVNFFFLLQALQKGYMIDAPMVLFLKQSSLIDRLWARLEMSKAASTTPSTVKKYSELLPDAIRKILRMPTKTDKNPPIGKKETSSENFGDDFRTIIDFFMSYVDEGLPILRLPACHSLVSLLELIDKHLSPGVLQEVVQNHPRSQELKSSIELIQQMTKMSDLLGNVNSYGTFYPKLVKENSIAVRERGKILGDYFDELLLTLSKCWDILTDKNEDFRSKFKSHLIYYESCFVRAMRNYESISPPRPSRSK